MPSIVFNNLPNQTPIPNANNLTGEADKYYELYMKQDRTQSGNVTYTSNTSGNYYSTTLYQTDADVYNKGELGMLNLLYKYVLRSYIVDASDINNLVNSISTINATVDCECTFDEAQSLYTLAIGTEPDSAIYTVRFRTPNDFVANSRFAIGTNRYVPVLSNSSESAPAGMFVADRIVIGHVDKTLKNITFLDGTPLPEPEPEPVPEQTFVVSDAEPTSDEDKLKLWVNSTDKTINYWDGTHWVTIATTTTEPVPEPEPEPGGGTGGGAGEETTEP